MFSALFSFLGGSVFRMIWGEAASFFTKRQDHANEMEMVRLQGELDQATHARSLENLRLQNDLGVRQIEVQGAADVEKTDADAFKDAMRAAWQPTGTPFIDAWNGAIRPAAASVVLALWAAKLFAQGFKMDDYDLEISGVVLGFFFADRGLSKRGK